MYDFVVLYVTKHLQLHYMIIPSNIVAFRV
jgi:hypothetical protein